MVDIDMFRDLNPQPLTGLYSAENVSAGLPIPKTKRIQLFYPPEWEEFTEEWASSLGSIYFRVVRFAGPGDKGLDVVGFHGQNFQEGWDNYQCKHYGHPMRASEVWVEIGKIIYYSFSGEYPPPKKCYFVAPQGIGTNLSMLLSDPEKLKAGSISNWKVHCETKITAGHRATLDGALLTYLNEFDFSIFSSKTPVDLIKGHSSTPFHAVRFGGGLPIRPPSNTPPEMVAATESRYIQQLFEAYSDNLGFTVIDIKDLNRKPTIKKHYLRQRERFYHAESLRNFARDNVPEGTFTYLQDDIYQGVVDICEADYEDGLERMRSTLAGSAQLAITANLLTSVTRTPDRQGICHQLANEDRLTWVPKK